MGIHPVAGAVAPAAAPTVEPKQAFGKVLQQARVQAHAHPHPQLPEKAPAPAAAEATAAKAVDQVARAQQRLERVLALAESGKTFTPAELLGLQAQVYSASQELDLAGKVVEKATSGVKQVLQTQL